MTEEWIEIVLNDDEPPYIQTEQKHAYVIDKISGSRARKLIERGKNIEQLPGDYSRHAYLLSGLTDYYVEEGLKAFSRVDQNLQHDVLAWINDIQKNPDNSSPFLFSTFRCGPRKLSCEPGYDGKYCIMVSRDHILAQFKATTLVKVAAKEWHTLQHPQGLPTNQL
ncbi:MAG: hypothetical protein RSE08_07790, partial [Lactococcus sp.]